MHVVTHQNRKRNTAYRISITLSLTPLVTALLGLAACSPPMPASEGTAQLRFLCGFNTSGSSRQQLPADVEFLAHVVPEFDPTTTWLDIWRTDRTTEDIWAKPMPESGESFVQDITPQLQDLPADSTSHTVDFWNAVAQASQHATSPCVVLLLGDGQTEGDDARAHHHILEAAKTLAAGHTKLVAIVGATAGTREQLKVDLAPLGSRLRFFDVDDSLLFAQCITGGH